MQYCYHAYEGQNYGHYGIDLIDKYEGYEIKKFEDYISDIELSPSEIVSLLQDYHISVKGDVYALLYGKDQKKF